MFNKHECNFQNSEIMEFVESFHAKSIGLWWGAQHLRYFIQKRFE